MPGLDDKPRTPHYPARKVTIREINEVKKLAEENPEMGAYSPSCGRAERC